MSIFLGQGRAHSYFLFGNLPNFSNTAGYKMGKKKKGSKKGKGKKGKVAKEDPAVTKALALADSKAAEKRKQSIEGVQWVNRTRLWFEKHRAQTFDVLRQLDSDKDGILSSEEFAEGMKKMDITLDEEELETLVLSVDFESDDKIKYCEPPQLFKCYGGSLQELINSGLERVMMNHRQDIAEIEDEHDAEIAEIKAASGAPAPAEDGGEGGEGGDDGGGDGAAAPEEAAAEPAAEPAA